MKQYDQDRENPDNIKKRTEKMKKIEKPKKKVNIAAMAHWHDINIEQILKDK